jgi:hypothetical protein
VTPRPEPEQPATAPAVDVDVDVDDDHDDDHDAASTLPPDTLFADDIPDDLPEPAAHTDAPQAFTREQVQELPAELVEQLGAAETLQPDTVFALDIPLEAPPAEPAPAGTPVPGVEDDDDDDDDDDVMELDAGAIMEEGVAPPPEPATMDMQDLLASLPPIPEADDDDDEGGDVQELSASDVLTMPDEGVPAIVAVPVPDGERDPEEVFDSIELALRTGTLPLEAGRAGLDDEEAGSLFQAFLSTSEEAARAADPAQIGEDTIVMDKQEAPTAPPASGDGTAIDGVALYRVIRRIFDETHQKLPTWLIARTIMTDPAAVYQLVLDALHLRRARDFIGYKETVADLFQRILATRLKHGKDIEVIERWLRNVVLKTAPGDEHERLAAGVDGVLINDRRLAEARGYKERGREGVRAALSLLESLAHGSEA